MPRTPWDLLRTILRRAASAGGADPPPDAELLDRFVRARDEAAFELLLWRHAALVLGVCRRVVPDDHLAEDAFQATFLILARKAGSVRRAGSVAGWLHRVARRVGARAAKKHVTRSGRESALTHDPAGATPPESPDELRSVLDQEIDRLPDRYRLPVVLCYLQERTTEDAARLLGVPRGTVLSRLATARKTLAARLTRRGVTAPVAGAGTAGIGSPAVGHELIAAALRPAVVFATGGSVAATSSQLATEVLRMTAWKQAAGLAAALVLTAGLGTGIGVVASAQQTGGHTPAAESKPADPSKPAAPAPPADPEKMRMELLARRQEAVEVQEREVLRRIQNLTAQRQQRQQELADDVDVQALRNQLARLDERILQAEDAIIRAEAELRSAQAAVGAVETARPKQNELTQMIEVDARVQAGATKLGQAMQRLAEIEAKDSDKDSPIVKAAREQVAKADAKLGETRAAVGHMAVDRWRAEARENAVGRLDYAAKSVASAKSTLDTHRKSRVALVKRIANMKQAENADQLLDDELRVYREFRQQLLRQRLQFQLERDGVTIPAGGAGSSADGRIEQLVREIQELKAAVKQLSEAKK